MKIIPFIIGLSLISLVLYYFYYDNEYQFDIVLFHRKFGRKNILKLLYLLMYELHSLMGKVKSLFLILSFGVGFVLYSLKGAFKNE